MSGWSTKVVAELRSERIDLLDRLGKINAQAKQLMSLPGVSALSLEMDAVERIIRLSTIAPEQKADQVRDKG